LTAIADRARFPAQLITQLIRARADSITARVIGTTLSRRRRPFPPSHPARAACPCPLNWKLVIPIEQRCEPTVVAARLIAPRSGGCHRRVREGCRTARRCGISELCSRRFETASERERLCANRGPRVAIKAPHFSRVHSPAGPSNPPSLVRRVRESNGDPSPSPSPLRHPLFVILLFRRRSLIKTPPPPRRSSAAAFFKPATRRATSRDCRPLYFTFSSPPPPSSLALLMFLLRDSPPARRATGGRG